MTDMCSDERNIEALKETINNKDSKAGPWVSLRTGFVIPNS